MKKLLVVVVLSCMVYLLAGSTLAEGQQNAYQAPASEDFSSLSWIEAFDKLHAKFSREYGFTEWKNINWPGLYNQFKPRIEQAQKANDFTAYYITLREYVHSIPDGHVHINSLSEIDHQFIGGGFGFSVARLSNGKLVVVWVDKNSEAYVQGMRAGAELITWNGRPVQAVFNEVSTIFYNNTATEEDLVNQKARYLVRAPIGTKLSLSFSSSSGEIMQALLVAYEDKGESLKRTYPTTILSDRLRDLILGVDNPLVLPESMVEKKILDGNIGYIKIWGELDVDLTNTGEAPSTLGLFRAALEEFNQKKVKGLILDIRNNVGGLDSIAADMLASFYTEKTLYEYQNCYNVLTGSWEIRPDEPQETNTSDPGLYIEPTEPYFSGPIVALINSKCISSGEGLAMGVKNLPNGETLGFYGTNGSFGLVGDEVQMPVNIEIRWPHGQSLDRNKQVQIDSRDGVGGVAPSIRIPMTLENALRSARGEDVELEQAIEYIRDQASFGALPPDIPGLVPVATFDEGRSYRASIGGYPVLSLKGNWREMGRQYGALLSKELREFHTAISADLEARGLKPEHLEQMRATFETYTPEMKDLIEGMSETSGLSFEDHMLLDASFYLLPNLVITAAQSASSCSGIAVSGPRTTDGTLYFARNWDMTPTAMRPYLRYIALIAFNPTDGGLAFANIRPIGQVYVETGMNEAGVFVELNNGSASDPNSNPEARFSVASLFDFLRTSNSLDDMIRNLTTTKMDASYIIQAASADRAVSVEIPTFDARVIEEKDGALYALNNFTRPTYAPWKGKIVELPDNAHDDRQVALDAMFASPEWRKGVNLNTVKAMMDRTLDKGGPVVEGPTFGTVLQVIAIPKDLRVLFRGYGYSGWADVDLKALFN